MEVSHYHHLSLRRLPSVQTKIPYAIQSPVTTLICSNLVSDLDKKIDNCREWKGGGGEKEREWERERSF